MRESDPRLQRVIVIFFCMIHKPGTMPVLKCLVIPGYTSV
jgi:hypothetical protein